jgi:hypothetical protein
MDRRFQVFVSSTFEDLREERSAVISALLQLDCIPAGMELFPAADDDSWTLIKSVIDDCDYYVLIVAGRCGSVHPETGKAYTQMEYEYAMETKKPIIALVHASTGLLPASKTEQSDEGRNRLSAFLAEVKKRNCRLWNDRGELTTALLTGVLYLKKTRPVDGWVRGTVIPEPVKDELLRLRRQVDELTIQLHASTMRVEPSDNLIFAQGADPETITYSFSECTSRVQLTWDYMIRVILPLTYGGGADSDAIARALRRAVAEYERDNSFDDSDHLSAAGADFKVSHSEYAKVVNQMFALGLIEPRPHPTLPASTIWFATPYGCRFGAKMVAIRRDLPGPATT